MQSYILTLMIKVQLYCLNAAFGGINAKKHQYKTRSPFIT